MALFKKDSEKKTDAVANEDYSWVIISPRITEKAAMISGDNVYTFDVATKANKIQIKKAIKAQYNVSPKKVNVIAHKSRKATKRGRKVHVSGSKKAMVYLKKGDSIELA
ncbi:MAG: 50S ribosomal protein L23 [Minisyncoccia bacterium]